jgi:hypothetical protein
VHARIAASHPLPCECCFPIDVQPSRRSWRALAWMDHPCKDAVPVPCVCTPAASPTLAAPAGRKHGCRRKRPGKVIASAEACGPRARGGRGGREGSAGAPAPPPPPCKRAGRAGWPAQLPARAGEFGRARAAGPHADQFVAVLSRAWPRWHCARGRCGSHPGAHRREGGLPGSMPQVIRNSTHAVRLLGTRSRDVLLLSRSL